MVFDDAGVAGGGYPGALVADLGTFDATVPAEHMLTWSTTITAGTALWAAVIAFGWTTTAPHFVNLNSGHYGEPDIAPYQTAAALVNKTPSICYRGSVASSSAPTTAPGGMAAWDGTGGQAAWDYILRLA
jgi:hypothetical protein